MSVSPTMRSPSPQPPVIGGDQSPPRSPSPESPSGGIAAVTQDTVMPAVLESAAETQTAPTTTNVGDQAPVEDQAPAQKSILGQAKDMFEGLLTSLKDLATGGAEKAGKFLGYAKDQVKAFGSFLGDQFNKLLSWIGVK